MYHLVDLSFLSGVELKIKSVACPGDRTRFDQRKT
jgi:hypothetical protein